MSALRNRTVTAGEAVSLGDGLATAHRRDVDTPTSPTPRDELTVTVAIRGGLVADVALSSVDLLREGRPLERPNELLLLVQSPGRRAFVTTAGRSIESASIAAALDANATSVMLTRPAAALLGLPARTAVAGLSRVDGGFLGKWGVAVVAGAARERDRENRARARLILSVIVSAGIVSGFGSSALSMQRKKLELARELYVNEMLRERDEALARASRFAMMGTFATGVAHQIATPLSVIAGRAQQLLDRARCAEDERNERHLRPIVEQADRIHRVMRGFLDLARGGAPAIAELEPAALMRGAVRLVKHRFEEAHVALLTHVPSGLGRVHGDEGLLEHAVVNLLLNACEACRDGGHVTLTVSVSDGKLDLEVRDDGAGITVEDAARALEPFFTTKPIGKGSGLGLAITNEIAKAHRGSLTIGPHAPAGPRACLRIPITADAVAPAKSVAPKAALEGVVAEKIDFE